MSVNSFISIDNAEVQGRLLRYLRKMGGYKQNEMAEKFGVSQSMISKLEKGTLDLDFKTWVLVQREFSLSTYEMAYGYMDALKPLKSKNAIEPNVASKFKIDARYGKLPGSSARATRPIVELAFKTLGYENAMKFFKDLKLDLSYFSKLDNPISANYHLDIAKMLMDKNILNKDTLNELTPVFKMKDIHGALASKYEKNDSAVKKINTLVENINRYEIDKFYDIHDMSDDSLYISVVPNKCIDNIDSMRGETGEYLGLYVKNYLNAFAEDFCGDRENGKNVNLIESYANPKHSRWLYQVEL